MKEAQTTARRLLKEAQALRQDVMESGDALAEHWRPLVDDTSFQHSAQNLAHYLTFRRHDLRAVQEALTPLGVSSLGRCEAHVLPTLDALIATLGAIAGGDPAELPAHPPRRHFAGPARTLDRRSMDLLGPSSAERDVRILVTLPTEAAFQRSWVRKLIEAGTNCVRINCAHDGPEIWLKMIENVRAAGRGTKTTCRVLMDLTGPRARTGEVLLPAEGSRVMVKDRILLTRDQPTAHSRFPFQTRCSLPEVFDDLKRGRIVCFDEARIQAKVERMTSAGAELRVVTARPKGEKFRADMALNFPGTDLHIPPLTEKDLINLDFVVEHADLVGYSFVQRPEDISVLLGELDARRARFKRKTKLGIVAKIETDRAVHNLPEIIVRAAGRGPFGVMIARGDLSVEVGFRRVAELQEEILWLCEAAHVPVIWATQVLETLAKKGVPTRAEITDAAMAERAECVMLNKGPFILDAVRTLDSVLSRMAGHNRKKSATLRALHSWEHLFHG
jgi:pyruvate kinase